MIAVAVLGRGFLSRIAIFLGLLFGDGVSWIANRINDVRVCRDRRPSSASHSVR